ARTATRCCCASTAPSAATRARDASRSSSRCSRAARRFTPRGAGWTSERTRSRRRATGSAYVCARLAGELLAHPHVRDAGLVERLGLDAEARLLVERLGSDLRGEPRPRATLVASPAHGEREHARGDAAPAPIGEHGDAADARGVVLGEQAQRRDDALAVACQRDEVRR